MKILKILAGIIAAIVLLIVMVFYLTSGMADKADDFFKAVKADDYDKAYTYLSTDFKKSTPKQQLKKYLQNNSLTDFKESSWNNRSFTGSRGNIKGTVITVSGNEIPLSIDFLKTDGEWKIYAINKPASGIIKDAKNTSLPTEQQQIKLVNESMLIFAESVADKNMEKLYNHVSYFWQKQMTVEKLTEVFKSFYKFGNALNVIKNFTPQFSEPANINEKGVLIIKGTYPTKPSVVYFEHKYIYEGLGWKLVGINVNIK